MQHYTDRLFRFRGTRPRSLRFRSGEFVMIGLPNAEKPVFRAYSIASPSWDDTLEFYSIKVQDGPLTSRLQHIQPGDRIILSGIDHDANVSPWMIAARDRGVAVRMVDFEAGAGCSLDPAAVAAVVGPRTRLVAVTHASNALGSIVDVAAVAAQLVDGDLQHQPDRLRLRRLGLVGEDLGCLTPAGRTRPAQENSIVSSCSTSIVLRLRNSVTRIASPMAASAAATVRMKNTNTWPEISFR